MTSTPDGPDQPTQPVHPSGSTPPPAPGLPPDPEPGAETSPRGGRLGRLRERVRARGGLRGRGVLVASALLLALLSGLGGFAWGHAVGQDDRGERVGEVFPGDRDGHGRFRDGDRGPR